MQPTLDQGATCMGNPLLAIRALGQSIWLDNISRELLDSGTLARLIAEDGISGVTSNPTIFEKAIGHSELYDRALTRGRARRPRRARDLLQARLRRHPGRRGRCCGRPTTRPTARTATSRSSCRRSSRATPPARSRRPSAFRRRSTARTCSSRCRRRREGVEAFRELTAAGVSVNVTLLFAVERYEEIANAWIDGLERRVAGRRAGRPARLGRELLRLARGQARSTRGSSSSGAATCRASPRSPTPSSPTARSSGSSRARAGRRWRPRARTCSARCGPRRRPRTRAYPDTLYVDTLIGPRHRQHDARRDDRRHARPRRRGASRSTRRSTSPRRTWRSSTRIGVDLDADPPARAGRRGRRVVHEVVRLPDRDDRRQGARAGSGAGMSAGAEVARLFARDASLWTSSGEDEWLGWIDAVEEGQRGLADAAVVGRPARRAPRARRAVRHGRLEPGAARDRRAARQRPAARARLDRSRRRARHAGRGLAVRDRLEVGLDDRAQLLRRRVLGARPTATARASWPSPTRARRSRSGPQGRLGARRPRPPRRRRPLLGADGVRARAGRARGHRRRADARSAPPRRSRSATTSSASTRARRSRT